MMSVPRLTPAQLRVLALVAQGKVYRSLYADRLLMTAAGRVLLDSNPETKGH